MGRRGLPSCAAGEVEALDDELEVFSPRHLYLFKLLSSREMGHWTLSVLWVIWSFLSSRDIRWPSFPSHVAAEFVSFGRIWRQPTAYRCPYLFPSLRTFSTAPSLSLSLLSHAKRQLISPTSRAPPWRGSPWILGFAAIFDLPCPSPDMGRHVLVASGWGLLNIDPSKANAFWCSGKQLILHIMIFYMPVG